MYEPANIGWIGSSPLWVWFGNPWLLRTSELQERHPKSFLTGKLFYALKNYVSEMDVYRGYTSKEAALDALKNAQESLNPATWNGSGI